MKNLSEKMNFSRQKPQNGEQYHEFEVRLTASTAMFETFRLFLSEVNINLYDIDDNELEACIDCFTDYFNATKEALYQEGIDEVTRYFWIDEE